jgi:hypothetical protein
MKAVSVFLFSLMVFSAPKNKDGQNFEYKKYEKFDFSELTIDGDNDGIGDLSIMQRFQTNFENNLPHKSNFNRELRDAVLQTL